MAPVRPAYEGWIKPKLFQWVKPTLFNVILSITPSFWSFNLRKWVVLIPYAVHFCCNIDRYQNYFLFWPRSHIASISPRVTLAHPANVSTCVISLSQSKVGTENNKVRSVPMTSDPITKGFWVTTCYIYILYLYGQQKQDIYIYINIVFPIWFGDSTGQTSESSYLETFWWTTRNSLVIKQTFFCGLVIPQNFLGRINILYSHQKPPNFTGWFGIVSGMGTIWWYLFFSLGHRSQIVTPQTSCG